MRTALPAAFGILADQVLGEPPVSPHPVALFGQVMRAVERRCYRDRKSAGALHAAIGVGAGLAAGSALRSDRLGDLLGGRRAGRSATPPRRWRTRWRQATSTTPERCLPALVGRDPTGLDEKEIARAVVESVAENTVDAVVAPALWAAVAGAPGALGYRAVNTLDAMVGHRSLRYQRYGWASARLDDGAGWVPARVTAVLVAIARPSAATEVWRTVRRDAGAHPSPNGGVAESAFAAALGLRLGGTNRYGTPPRVELRPTLGTGRPPEPADIARAVALSRDVALVLAAALTAAGVLAPRRPTRRPPSRPRRRP